MQVIGREEYLLGGYRLEQYKHIRQALSKGYDPKNLTDALVPHPYSLSTLSQY